MANRLSRLRTKTTLHCAAMVVAASVMTLTGCQTTPKGGKSLSAATLPPPSFEGPRIVKSAPVAVAPKGVAPTGPAAWRPRVPARDWNWIVVHHSASPAGNMAMFDKEHKSKGWDGIGYHFVIGNGTNSGDGQVEVTSRWSTQKWGAHAKTLDNRYNEQGIGICLVGNFDLDRPTPAQLESLTKLTAYLMQTHGIPAANVIGHRDTKATDCPGRYVNVAAIRKAANDAVAAGGSPSIADHARAASGTTELLTDVAR